MRSRLIGYTLVEVLITVTLMGILAAFAIPQLLGQVEKSYGVEATNMLRVLKGAEENYKNQTGQYFDIFGGGCYNGLEEEWLPLGVADPNPVGNKNHFLYCVDTATGSGPDPTRFKARALRKDGPHVNKLMCLNQNGIWSGNYPHTPDNLNGVPCDPTPGGNGPCC